MSNITIHHGDCWRYILEEEMILNNVDAIITDPPYDAKINLPLLADICKGPIIMFCDPARPFLKPDEKAYWIKTPSTKNFSKHLGRFVEEILILRGNYFNPDLHWSNYTGVYDDRLLAKQDHPFQKPLPLIERLMAIYTRPGSVVFDPFMGSGTTLRAARNLGRSFIGCEIDDTYFQMCLDIMEGKE